VPNTGPTGTRLAQAALDGDDATAHIQRLVGRNKKVLELGADSDAVSRPLVEARSCRVTVVAPDPAGARMLGSIFEQIVPGDPNDTGWISAVPQRAFDAVVIGDALATLHDPPTVLRHARKLLNDTGRIVVAIPHASHAGFIGSLLQGGFSDRDRGSAGRVGRRFSLTETEDMFAAAGLTIVEARFVVREPIETEFAAGWRSLAAEQQTALEAGPYAKIYQIVVAAVPSERTADLIARPLGEMVLPQPAEVTFIAFYLPQFHPIPENDAWWGKGFTEWTNVTKARPLFEGHYQPHLPADLGFYDLRVREIQHQQITYAKKFGIDAFCFHYYWFNGRRLLERPLDDFLADQDADFQFCLCWANENWTRKWDGSENEILLAQDYTPASDSEFVASLLPYLRDPRYLRIDGAALLVVYCPQYLPDVKSSATRWRQLCRDAGLGEIHLAAALTHGNWNYEQFGFDAGVEFPPHGTRARDQKAELNLYAQIDGLMVRFGDLAEQYLANDYTKRRVYRGVVPSWDNTARVNGRGLTTLDATPVNYERWLNRATHLTMLQRTPSERLVFINAWNEWAEGCHLEPDQRFGCGFLEATLRVKNRRSLLEASFSDDNGATRIIRSERSLPVRVAIRLLRRSPGLLRLAKLARTHLRRLATWARRSVIARRRPVA
jgi:SAM-dependent methyltransferase